MQETSKHKRQLRDQVLWRLQADSDRLNKEIANDLGIDTSRVSRLRAELKESGYIKQCKAVLNPDLLGFHTCAFVFLKVEIQSEFENTIKFLLNKPEIQDLHCVQGDFDFIIKIRTRTNKDLFSFISDALTKQHNIAHTNTVIVMDTRQESLDLPLETSSSTSRHDANEVR